MATVFWEGVTSNWGTAGNWSGASVPVTGDDVIFDGRVSQSVGGAAATGMDQTGVDLNSLTIMPSYLGSIGDNDAVGAGGPLIIEIQNGGTKLLWIRGQGDYYIQCGNDANDADITNTVIDTPGTVGLSSQRNIAAGNVGLFTTINAVRGILFIFGNADNTTTGADDRGTAYGTLYVAPTSNNSATLEVTIGDECINWKTGTKPTIYESEGTLNLFSEAAAIWVFGGVCNIGGTDYAMDDDDDDIVSLVQFSGTVTWNPTTPVTTPTESSASPTILLAFIFGGKFDASGMLATNTTSDTAPTITSLTQYAGSVVDLSNSYANIVVTTYTKRGGTLKSDPGQAITLS